MTVLCFVHVCETFPLTKSCLFLYVVQCPYDIVCETVPLVKSVWYGLTGREANDARGRAHPKPIKQQFSGGIVEQSIGTRNPSVNRVVVPALQATYLGGFDS